jgi:RES domain-containing protein
VIYSGCAYRAHDPKWAFSPLSGEGAAVHGGRFNPKGKPALYLALTPEGAVLEASHGFAYRFEPLTICTYEIADMPLADLTDRKFLGDQGISTGELSSDWFQELSESRRPASWIIYDRLRNGWCGIRVPSFARMARHDMHNIVLWRWQDLKQGQISIFDPAGRFPKNQKTWE